MQKEIKQQIKQQKLISIRYDGTDRIVEPYTYGINTKGNEALRVYQIDGYSSSGKPNGWKMFMISRIDSLDPLDEKFHVRSEYTKNDSGFKTIIQEIE